jgi:hypothetical protein
MTDWRYRQDTGNKLYTSSGDKVGWVDTREARAAQEAAGRWDHYMRRGIGGRHMDQLEQIHQQQLAAAEAYYAGATAPSNLQAAQLRGAALQGTMGGLSGGGLEARQAIYGAGAGAYGAGLEGTQAGSEARLSAADAYMSAQADRARYDMALAQAFQERERAAEASAQASEQARLAREHGEGVAARQALGATASAGGSLVAGMGSDTGGGGGGGDQNGYGGSKYST